MQRRAQGLPRGLVGSNRRFAGFACAVIACAFVAIASACSNQGEGDRCDSLNGNDDCSTGDGLICYPAAQLTGATDQIDRCCPADRSKSTVPICILRVSPISDAGQQTTEDTGTGTADSAVDAATPPADSSVDTTDADTDASPSDASSDGPSE